MGDLYVAVKAVGGDDNYHTSVHGAVTLFVVNFCRIDRGLKLRFVEVCLPGSGGSCICIFMFSFQLHAKVSFHSTNLRVRA